MSDDSASAAPVLLVLAGPAGSGKTTLCERMVAEVPGFSRVVTSTTREPRPGEVNGRDYHFFTAKEFDHRLAADAFLEWALVHRKHRYGTLAASVFDPLAAGQSLIINVDVQGVENFRGAAKKSPLLARHMATVYVDVPIDELRVRLTGRGDSEAEIERRMVTAVKEQQERDNFDHVITSSSKEADFQALVEIWRVATARVAQAD
ncbi:MAG: AAA family ATPase [Opitutaceae bacterium]|jgi:guanylate kinase|nr:AAA family ATPase [Opitutaceae bacterium]